VLLQHVDLVEGALVQQQVEAFTGGVAALLVVLRYAVGAAAHHGHLAAGHEVVDARLHMVHGVSSSSSQAL
jgi:hypothetical protein